MSNVRLLTRSAAVLLLVLTLLVVAGPAAAAPRGRVVVAFGTDTSTMDPHMHTERIGIIVNQHIFDTLLARDTKTWQPVPHLAESVKAVNATTWELKLRRGVKFHNGEPFTAESVKFSFDRLNTYAGSIVAVEQVGQAVMGYLARIGVRVKPRHFADVEQYLASFRASKLDGIIMASWGYNSVFDSDAIYYVHFHSGQPYTYNTSKEMDAWLDEARSTVDPKKRMEIYARFQRHLVDRAYWVPMYAQYTIEAVSNKLNYEASSDEIMRVHAATWKP